MDTTQMEETARVVEEMEVDPPAGAEPEPSIPGVLGAASQTLRLSKVPF